MSLAKPQSPGCKLPSFPAHWICGSYSPSWAAPTKSALLSSTVAIFRSRSGAICLYDLCWENGLWKTGHSKFLRLSSFDLQLPSSQVSQGHFLKKSIDQARNSAFTCSSGEAWGLVYLPQQHWEKSNLGLSGLHIVGLFDTDILNEDILSFFW